MSASTIVEEEFDEKHLSRPRPDLVRAETNVEKAIDAEANIDISTPLSDATASDHGDTPGPPPNGGLQAWMQVAGSFFLFFNSWYVF